MGPKIFLHLPFAIIVILLSSRYSHAHESKVSAVFVFGDSTVDPGNNNYLPTIARGNYPPYGKDFHNHIATGRFSNGRLVTDFIGEFMGLKENLPPYLDPNLTIEDLMTGVSFASSANGYDAFTCHFTSALTLLQQLDMFKDYKQKLEVAIGKEKTNDLITRASYLISSGTNDFTLNYYGPIPVRRSTYPNISEYQQFMWQKIEQFIQELTDEGAKKIGLVGVPPIGCLPAMITLHSKTHPIINDRKCIKNLNAISKMFNQMLQDNLDGLRRPGIKIMYLDIYKPIIDMVEQKTLYGFEEVHKGCCGTGLIEAGFLCNSNSRICDDVSKYIFWDAFHPTEKGYRVIFDSLQSHLLENIS